MSAGSPPTTQVNQSSTEIFRLVDNRATKAEEEQKIDRERETHLQSPCETDNSDIKGIQLVIKNLQNDIERIKRFSNVNSAFDALTNENTEPWKSIKKVINFSASDIAGYVKNIMERVRGWVLNTIQNKAKEILPFLFPGEVPSFLDALGKGTNALSCAFAKIIRGLAKTVGNLLLGLIDKFINGPMCLAENFVNNLLNEILGPIQAAIESALALIGGALSAVQNLANSLFNALDFVTGILNFFKCDDDQSCPIVESYTLSGAGQHKPTGGDSSPSPESASTGQSATGAGLGDSKGTEIARVSTADNTDIDQTLNQQKEDYGQGTTAGQRAKRVEVAKQALDRF